MQRGIRTVCAAAVAVAAMAWAEDGRADPYGLERIADGLFRPVYVTAPPGDTERLFVVQQRKSSIDNTTGLIQVLDLSTRTLSPFLEIPGISRRNNEGLLSMAFHPQFFNATPGTGRGEFYVHRSASDGASEIVEYAVTGDPATSTTVNPASERLILRIDSPVPGGGHRGGWIGFAPDLLHVAVGDQWSLTADPDPLRTGQDKSNLYASILRLDVDGADAYPGDPNRNYAIPATNPGETDATFAREVLAYGLRNPWRASYDPVTNRLIAGDVGQDAVEEINVIASGGNYGWREREGTACSPFIDPGDCLADGDFQDPPPIDPIHAYAQSTQGGFASVTGGYVYRGSIESLQGEYFFGDFVSGKIFSFPFDGTSAGPVTDWTDELMADDGVVEFLVSFGEGGTGDLFLVDYGRNTDAGGEIFLLTGSVAEPPSPALAVGALLAAFAASGCGDRLQCGERRGGPVARR